MKTNIREALNKTVISDVSVAEILVVMVVGGMMTLSAYFFGLGGPLALAPIIAIAKIIQDRQRSPQMNKRVISAIRDEDRRSNRAAKNLQRRLLKKN